MKNKRPTQCQRILDYIAEFGSITHLEAIRDLGVQRLASRITELKNQGYSVTHKWETVKNRYGEKSRIKRYSIEIKSPVNYEMPYSAGMSGTMPPKSPPLPKHIKKLEKELDKCLNTGS